MAQNRSPFDGYLTAAQTAKVLGFNAESVRRLARNGRLEAYQFGREWAFPEKVVRDYKTYLAGVNKHGPRNSLN